VYASTEEILYKALVDTKLFEEIKTGNFEEIKINEGDILHILQNGTIVYDKFNYIEYFGRCDWRYFDMDYDDLYVEDLKAVAAYQGYSEEDIDELIEGGFTPEEIEEYIYSCE
jgi:translation initiation factor 2 beta subunit (eIF-2beta)/eIF-5